MPKRERMVLAVFWTLMSAMTAIAQEPRGLPQPRPEHKKLGAFLSTWKDEAEMKPGPLGGGGRMSLTQTCEWFTGVSA